MESKTQLALRAAWMTAQGCSDEAILRELRDAGASTADCVMLLADARGIELAEAQERVVNSAVWEDHRETYLRLEKEFWKAAEQLGEIQPDGSIRIDLRDLDP